MPVQELTHLRLAAPLLMAVVLALAATPPAAAGSPITAAAPAVIAPAAEGHEVLHLHGDTNEAASSARTRRASYAWKGVRILYTESIPVQWDWSLSTAIAKWNSTGGGIKFVKAANSRKAKLRITVGNIGGAAGMATVGRRKRASVQLSSSYNGVSSLVARNRVQVMGIFAHELGHVLGFQHTSSRCSLMSPVLDVDGCSVLPATLPGYYKCRTIDGALATRFVRVYGGRARFPSVDFCPIDPLPPAVSRVTFDGGPDATVMVRWAKPASVPAGSRVEIRSWNAETCDPVPPTAGTAFAPVDARVWQDSLPQAGPTCYRVQLVNRYGAGGTAVSRLLVL